jgi:hypothetical protein
MTPFQMHRMHFIKIYDCLTDNGLEVMREEAVVVYLKYYSPDAYRS